MVTPIKPVSKVIDFSLDYGHSHKDKTKLKVRRPQAQVKACPICGTVITVWDTDKVMTCPHDIRYISLYV